MSGFSRYFTPEPDPSIWSLWVHGAGRRTGLPGIPSAKIQYAPPRFPRWMPQTLRFVLVSAGRGWIETPKSGRCELESGTAFVVDRGQRHAYGPMPGLGWEECWLELRGPMVTQMKFRRILAAYPAVIRNAAASGLEEAILVVLNEVRAAGDGFDPEISALAYRVMATWTKSREREHGSGQSRVARAIKRAVQVLNEKLEAAIDVHATATELGMGYSHFRREFKARTGYAPWKYVLNQRLIRARRILASTDATQAEIAERFGFSSPFHFSRAFHQAFGLYPAHWRQQVSRDPACTGGMTPDNVIHLDLIPKTGERNAIRPLR